MFGEILKMSAFIGLSSNFITANKKRWKWFKNI